MMKKNIVIECFDVVPFMKQKQIRNKRKETKRRSQKKAKKKDKKEEKKKTRERQREIEKGGGQNRLRRNKGRDSKINKKCPFLGEKQFLF